jgi:hypothetical protein
MWPIVVFVFITLKKPKGFFCKMGEGNTINPFVDSLVHSLGRKKKSLQKKNWSMSLSIIWDPNWGVENKTKRNLENL